VSIKIGNLQVSKEHPLLIIAGPCVIESWDVLYKTAQELKNLSEKMGFALVFKSSFDKANRTSNSSFRGPGLEKGLAMLSDIKSQLGLPVVSDVHETEQVRRAGEVLDLVQIPAFLCRQTDLLVAAAETGKAVNIKKGQFVAPQDMKNAVSKVLEAGNPNVLLTERGTTFGYNNLVVDMRSIPMMQENGVPEFSTRRTACNFPAVVARSPPVSASTFPIWPEPLWLLGAMGCSWKCIRIRTTRNRMVLIRFHWRWSKS
jgi:3-deoxy-D-manno-octulosonic acid (KDO) 8-phosphate synthase